jgi:hypothetical protein
MERGLSKDGPRFCQILASLHARISKDDVGA